MTPPTNDKPLTRRVLLRTGIGFGAAVLAGCTPPVPGPGGGGDGTSSVVAFKRSGKNRHVSNAAKKHNANHLYATLQAAQADIPHPGDNSKVVQVTLSRARFNQLFPNNNQVADLRHV